MRTAIFAALVLLSTAAAAQDPYYQTQILPSSNGYNATTYGSDGSISQSQITRSTNGYRVTTYGSDGSVTQGNASPNTAGGYTLNTYTTSRPRR
jgi:hypothetical protein